MARGGILTVLLMVACSGVCCAAVQNVPDGYVRVARAHGIPAELLYAVSLTETSMSPEAMSGVLKQRRRDFRQPDVARPWPWTINVAGKGYRYATRLEAWQALQVFLKHYPAKRIDVGIAQVNLGWNGHRFPSTWAAFDPYTSLNTAAVILQECRRRHPVSWLQVAGCYHHPAGGAPAARYTAVVRRHLARLHRDNFLNPSDVHVAATAMLTPSPRYIWTEPQEEQK
ncbi:TPA: transglycosylase SLT domain-containing protein [Escherichia coli O146]|nr:transglycosylase SLT domain-containing protein [Escherichia coli O146]HBC3016589.1 transglycosylase SLT domain-containing protein [Escherichia coli O146]HBC3047240.1 transglycosylase SLT domain-containing protein [Escherichia coli O146]HBC3082288.1 transglycosylase SLT domain-containing protein [Escherichia coli O146]HBC3167593.1 transglycosylase SLT domain-containing protein [Escherichia coli O146]